MTTAASLSSVSGLHPSTAAVRATIGATPRGRLVRWLRWAPLVVVLALVVVVVRRVRAGGPAVTSFETVVVTRGDLRVTVTATGTLEAVTTVEVGAEVTGRLLEVRVEANDAVKKGQVLAVIDPEQLRAAVDQAAAQVVAANAAILQAKATTIEAGLALERARKLASSKLLGTGDVETAVANEQRAAANLESAKANTTLAVAAQKLAVSKLAKSTIYSPIDGVVLSRLVEPGQTLTAGFTTPVLFKIAQDLTKMRLKVDVDEADVGRVGEGDEATFTVEAYPDRNFVSRVLTLQNEPTTSSNVVTYKAVLTVDNSLRLLRPGMTSTATIVAQTQKDALLVPNAALRFSPPQASRAGPPGPAPPPPTPPEGMKFVYVLRDGKPTALAVHAGATDGAATAVTGDLAPGALVVTDVKDAPP